MGRPAELQKEIEEAVRQCKGAFYFTPVEAEPLIGTLPTTQVNARAIHVKESNEYLVLFETEIFHFLHLLSKAVALALPPMNPLKPDEALMDSKAGPRSDAVMAGHDRFSGVMKAYLLEGRPSRAEAYSVSSEHMVLADTLRVVAELFVMGHEYGHIISGHFSEEDLAPVSIAGVPVNEFHRRWQQEYEADQLGTVFAVTSGLARGIPRTVSCVAIVFFFAAVMFMERGISILRTGEDNDNLRVEDEKVKSDQDTHPPAKLRIALIDNDVIRPMLRSDYADFSRRAKRLMQTMYDLWKPTAAALVDYHNRGVGQANSWLRT